MKALFLYISIALTQLPFTTSEISDDRTDRENLVRTAVKFLNSDYKSAGNSPNGFDCSGFTQYVYKKALGVELLHGSKLQADEGRRVKLKKAKKGDLIFFKKGNRINHVGLITKISRDEIWVIHATSSKGVILEDIYQSSYWKSKISSINSYLR